MTGDVTLNLARAIAAVHNGDTINGIPYCKEYQTGSCSRGIPRCRYWHINIEEERERRRRTRSFSAVTNSSRVPALPYGYGSSAITRRPLEYTERDLYDGSVTKRARYDCDQREYLHDLERRNAELIKENEGLKRQLQREHDRYQDLYALFRQRTTPTSVSAPVAPPTPAGDPTAPAAYNAATYAASNIANAASGVTYYPSNPPSWTNPSTRSQWNA